MIAFFILVDFPSTALFLTPEERSYLVWRKSKLPLCYVASQQLSFMSEFDNSSVGEEERFQGPPATDAPQGEPRVSTPQRREDGGWVSRGAPWRNGGRTRSAGAREARGVEP